MQVATSPAICTKIRIPGGRTSGVRPPTADLASSLLRRSTNGNFLLPTVEKALRCVGPKRVRDRPASKARRRRHTGSHGKYSLGKRRGNTSGSSQAAGRRRSFQDSCTVEVRGHDVLGAVGEGDR